MKREFPPEVKAELAALDRKDPDYIRKRLRVKVASTHNEVDQMDRVTGMRPRVSKKDAEDRIRQAMKVAEQKGLVGPQIAKGANETLPLYKNDKMCVNNLKSSAQSCSQGP